MKLKKYLSLKLLFAVVTDITTDSALNHYVHIAAFISFWKIWQYKINNSNYAESAHAVTGAFISYYNELLLPIIKYICGICQRITSTVLV